MTLRELLTPPFKTVRPTSLPLPYGDTLYEVKTVSRNFCGRIVHDDEVTLHLQTINGKPVKILKENILKISIDESY